MAKPRRKTARLSTPNADEDKTKKDDAEVASVTLAADPMVTAEAAIAVECEVGKAVEEVAEGENDDAEDAKVMEDGEAGSERKRKKRKRARITEAGAIHKLIQGDAANASEPVEESQTIVTSLNKVHRLRFLKQSLYPVRCLAWEPFNRRLAVSRNEGSIELWSFHPDPTRSINYSCWYVERRIPGAISRKAESLVWCRRRLFAAGTSGLLLEFDAAFNVAREIPASGGGIIAMAANEALGKIALASIDGTVLVYDVTEEGLVYDKTLEKRKERIMSLDWHVDGKTIVTGCKGNILIWDYASGRVTSHIALSKSLTKRKGKRGRLLQKSTLIWTIKLLTDGTIVTGDSEGNLSFWDLDTATLRTQFKTHMGPILTLCIAQNQNAVWCSGVDPRIVEVRRKSEVNAGWQLGHVNEICTRDVHALAYVQMPGHTSEGIVFAGDDPRLIVTCVRKLRKLDDDEMEMEDGSRKTRNARLTAAPASVSSMISLSRKKGILVSRVNRGIDIWKLGSSSSPSSSSVDSAMLPLDSEPSKLALIPGRKGVKDFYTSAAINADATFLCLSDYTQTDVFALSFSEAAAAADATDDDDGSNDKNDDGGKIPAISKIKALHGTLSPNLLFSDFCTTSGDDILVAVTANGRLEALRIHQSKDLPLDDETASSSSGLSFRKMAMSLASSSGLPTCLSLRTRLFRDGMDASFAAVGFASGRVDVVDILDGKIVASLPVLKGVSVTAVAFSPDATEITAVYANREVAFFHVDSQMTGYWPRGGQDPYEWRGLGKNLLPIQKIVYLSPTKLAMHSDKNVYVLERGTGDEANNLDNVEDADSVAKRVKLAVHDHRPFAFTVLKSFQVVHFVDVLENGELVVAETTLDKIMEKLPEPILKKKYGT